MNEFTNVEAGRIDLVEGRLGEVVLSPTERRLLQALAENAGDVVTKPTLLQTVWGLPPNSTSRTLYTTIERLRRKIEVNPKQPKHLFTMGREGYTFRPLDLVSSTPAVRSPDLVGRDRELMRVQRALATGAVVVLKGPAGVGKSRLAVEALPKAVLCDLGHATTRAAVLEAVAAALVLPLVNPSDPSRELRRLGRVASSMSPQGLILDGSERATEVLADLLESWPPPRPRILVTSRQALGIDAEEVVEVQPLQAEDAAALFVKRAQLRRPGWTPTPEESASVNQLVAALDGLPLAVELAARWSRLVTPKELLERANAHRLPLVAGAEEERPRRHQSLEAAIRWSWEALPERLRVALMAAAVFRGGARVADLERVLGPDGLDLIDALAQHSLVQVDADRVRVLEGVAAFATQQLSERPELDSQLRQKHARCYARYGRDDVMAALFVGGSRVILELARELGNLRTAVHSGLPDDAGRAALAWAAVARALGSQAEVASVLERVLELPIASADLGARLWAALAVVRRHSGDPGGAFIALKRAEELADGEVVRAEVDKVLGTALVYHGDPDEATAVLHRARAAFQRLGDAYSEGAVIAELACLELRGGRAAACEEQLQIALRLFRKVGACFAEAVYLGNLGVAQMKCDRFDAARATYLQALALHRELGSSRFEAKTLSNLGLLHALTRDHDASQDFYHQAIEASARTGEPTDEAIARCNLAWSLLAAGDLVTARRQLELASDVFDALQLPYQQADAALTRAWLCRAEGDLDGSDQALQRADALVRANAFGELRPSVHAQRGLWFLAAGDREAARASLRSAVETAQASDLEVGWDGHRYIEELRAGLDAAR